MVVGNFIPHPSSLILILNLPKQFMMTLDIDFTEFFLAYIVSYGAPALALALFLGALGAPLPGTLFVLAAGAFIRQGVLDVYQTIGLALLAVLVGDLLSYGLGRLFRLPVTERWGQKAGWQKAEAVFQKRGGTAVYLTRFLFTPLAIPTNLIAGTSGYPITRFIFFDLSGEATWFLLYGSLGYLVGSQWETLTEIISNFSGFVVGALLLGAGLYLVRRWGQARTATA
jgi:membrane-associated protein